MEVSVLVAVCGNSSETYVIVLRFVPRVRSDLLNKGTLVAVHDMKAYAGSSGVVPLIFNPTV